MIEVNDVKRIRVPMGLTLDKLADEFDAFAEQGIGDYQLVQTLRTADGGHLVLTFEKVR